MPDAPRTHQDATSPPRPSQTRPRSESFFRRPPPNPFILFRSDMIAKNNLTGMNISRIAGLLWRGLSDEQKEHYRQAAAVMKMRYQLEFPSYQYHPTRNRERERMARARQ